MADNKRLLSLVGLATGARKVTSGEFLMGKSVKSGKSHLVIALEEALDNTKKKFTNTYTYYKVLIYLLGVKDKLGHTMGQEFRASLSAEDAGFARSMVERMDINGGSLNESR